MKSPRGLISNKLNSGFTIIETLIALAIFLIISYYAYSTANGLYEIVAKNQWRADAIAAVENEIEIVRNLAYSDIGISGGYPTGQLLGQKTVSIGGTNFVISTTVRNIDDPFDGVAGGNPNDTAPADYKLVEFEVNCPTCANFAAFKITTTAAPKNLETATRNGSLFINVFDANGQPISQANVSIVNNELNPTISISDQTNNDGVLQLVDIPTSTVAYKITVSKNGYSSERTYSSSEINNATPAKPHSTVVEQEVTAISFSIDKTSSLNFTSADSLCQPISYVDYLLSGTKLLGSNPDVLKYSASSTTGSSGIKTISNLEWDTYDLTNLDADYEIIGTLPDLPLTINPDTSNSLKWIMSAKQPQTLFINIKDENNQPLSGASVNLTKSSFDKTLITGRYLFSQTAWFNQYSSQSGNIEDNSPDGEIKLKLIDNKYPTSTAEWLISNTFDLGTSNVSFYNISWQPENQLAAAGNESLKIQIASNNDNNTWNWSGPDGAENSYYTTSDSQIYSGHNNKRYFRYKIFMQTVDENSTPSLNEIKIDFNSSCVSGGQTFFNNLSSGVYNLTITKSGYQTYADSAVSVYNDWQEYKATLIEN